MIELLVAAIVAIVVAYLISALLLWIGGVSPRYLLRPRARTLYKSSYLRRLRRLRELTEDYAEDQAAAIEAQHYDRSRASRSRLVEINDLLGPVGPPLLHVIREGIVSSLEAAEAEASARGQDALSEELAESRAQVEVDKPSSEP